MKIKSGVWYWLAMACFVVGLLYGMGLQKVAVICSVFNLRTILICRSRWALCSYGLRLC